MLYLLPLKYVQLSQNEGGYGEIKGNSDISQLKFGNDIPAGAVTAPPSVRRNAGSAPHPSCDASLMSQMGIKSH